MATINLKINGTPVSVEEGASLLDAAKKLQVNVPTLCKHPDLEGWGACGLCIVKAKGSPKMIRACCTPAQEGQDIITHDPEIIEVRRTVLKLILSTHPNDCLRCSRNQNCELQRLTAEFNIREVPFADRVKKIAPDESTPSIVLNPEKCVLCGRCATVCQEMQNVWALEFIGRGIETRIAPAACSEDSCTPLNDSPCVKCGQCSAHCPVGAIHEKDDSVKVWQNLLHQDEKKLHTVAQIAPAVRVALGEAFGYEPGTIVTGKIYAALRRLGFDTIFDTNFGADLTIMEEGSEFIERFVHKKGELPLVTSCCPAWVDYMEKYYPDLIDHFSSAKSPHEMVGTMTKTYYAEKMGIDPANIYMVSIMPCTAKKYEITRTDEMFASGHQDIDVSLTTRELARMIKQAGIDFRNLPDEEADPLLGLYAGAGTIFGNTGGVMEAALRTAHHLVTGKKLAKVEFEQTRGLEGVKEAEIDIEGTKVRIAVAHELSNVSKVMDKIREAKKTGAPMPYDFIEVMACRGGCIGGGGQPYGATDEIRIKRTAGIYKDDEISEVRCSHENPAIAQIYKDYLGAPLSEKSHKLLHTHYKKRELYNS